MWRDENGFKHNGPSPYEQRKIEEYRSQMSFEEKYKDILTGFMKYLSVEIIKTENNSEQ